MLRRIASRLLEKAVIRAYGIHRRLSMDRSLSTAMKSAATAQALDFLAARAPKAFYLHSRFELLSFALKRVQDPGLYIELGVKRGRTINHIAKETKATIHGFDSFVGYPPGSYAPGKLRCDHEPGLEPGTLPSVPPNVTLHKGWFKDTLPPFLAHHEEQIAFLHVDCVVYESTATALTILGERLKPGSIIVFDDYFGYWGWQNHEHRAFEEFLCRTGHMVDYFAFAEQALAVKWLGQ